MKIESRPQNIHRGLTLIVGLVCSFIAVGSAIGFSFYDTPRNLNGWLLLLFIVVSYGFVGVWGLCYFFRAQILADEEGLRWRTTFSQWKFAKWDGISDFYVLKEPQSRIRVIETSQGSLQIGLDYCFNPNSKSHRKIAELFRLVLEKRASTKAQKYEVYNSHPLLEWPERFVYFTQRHKGSARDAIFIALVGIGISAYFFVPYLLGFQSDILREIFQQTPMLLSIMIGFFLLCPAIVCIWFALTLRKEQRNALLRRDEYVEISSAGIIFNGKQKISATWPQVNSISQNFSRQVLEFSTEAGNFEIHRSLVDFLKFSRSVEKLVPDLAKDWADDEEMKAEKSHRNSGKSGEESQVFHYLSSASLLMLLFLALMILTPLIGSYFSGLMLTPDDEPRKHQTFNIGIYFGIGGAVWIYCLLLILKSLILVDEIGLEIRSIFGKKRIIWNEINKYGYDRSGYFVEANGRRHKFAGGIYPQGIHILERLIATRSVNATGSWENPLTAERKTRPS